LFNKWECRRLTWPRHALWRIYTKSWHQNMCWRKQSF
jgi:hypothetical protein